MTIEIFLERFIYWLFFGMVLAIFPVLLSFTTTILLHPECTITENWIDSVSKGELLIICSALLGVNLGDLYREAPAPRYRLYHFFLVALSVILAMFTLAIFVFVNMTNNHIANDQVTGLSDVLLFITSIICLFSLLIERS